VGRAYPTGPWQLGARGFFAVQTHDAADTAFGKVRATEDAKPKSTRFDPERELGGRPDG
jgi:hypothetical protein